MKITDIRLDRLRINLDPPFRAAWDPVPRQHFDATIVRVFTDEGLIGIGSGNTMDGFEGHEDLFIGHDPMAISRHVRAIETLNFHAGRYWPLEAALWDIIGQVTGQPIAVLFGNACEELPAYASCGELKAPQERAESALALREQGFRGMKLRIAQDRLEEGIQAVAATRDAVGDEFALMVDLNQSWRMAGDVAPSMDFATVRDVISRLRELDVFWVEEPLPYRDSEGLRALRSQTGMRIAGGEMIDSVGGILHYIDCDALDIYQMDAVLAIGMSRARTIAELVQLRHRAFTPHSWTNGLGLMANLQVSAGIGGGPYFEFPYDPPGWTPERRDFLLSEPISITSRGTVRVPPGPGLGVHLDEAAIARYRR